jgi:hypothetical protein
MSTHLCSWLRQFLKFDDLVCTGSTFRFPFSNYACFRSSALSKAFTLVAAKQLPLDSLS